MNLGDGHFATARNFHTPIQRRAGRHSEIWEQIHNKFLQLVRSRVEHLSTVFKNHAVLKGVYRGFVINLAVFVKICAHGAAVEQRERGDRYAGYGWWKHF